MGYALSNCSEQFADFHLSRSSFFFLARTRWAPASSEGGSNSYQLSLRCRCTAQTRTTTPRLLLELCGFRLQFFLTLLLEHCLSLEEALFPHRVLSVVPLLPRSQQIRENVSCLYYAVGNSEPHRLGGTSVTQGKQSSVSRELTMFLLVR